MVDDPSDSDSDNRDHPRLPWVVRVDYPDREKCLDATENLSSGGLFVQTGRDFSIGEEVPLVLSFPGLLEPIHIVGTVAWIRPARGEEKAGVGIRVEREEDRTRLSTLVRDAPALSPPTAARPDPYRILLVEDNPHVVDMYSYVLRRLATGEHIRMQVEFASEGHEALGKLRARPFHLVITDLYMPVMDGFGLVERMRQEPELKSVPVVAISAAGREAERAARAAGVDVFLKKPVRFLEVLDTVKRLLCLN